MTNAEKILIVGTGTMGEGIAQTFAQNGFDVRLVARRDGTASPGSWPAEAERGSSSSSSASSPRPSNR